MEKVAAEGAIGIAKAVAPPVLALIAIGALYILLKWAFAEVTEFRKSLKLCVKELTEIAVDLKSLNERQDKADKTIEKHDVLLTEMKINAKDYVTRSEMVDSFSRSGNSIFARITSLDREMANVTRDIAVLQDRSGPRRKKTT